MRKITLTLFTLMVAVAAYCGAPQAINYQAVVLNSAGSPIKTKNVSLRLSILAGSSTGTMSYQEKQSVTTDNSGIVSLQIGNGDVQSGSFTNIDWSTGIYFLKTEIDTTGTGTTYTTIGNVQFFSVPYSLYSATSGQSNLGSADYPDGLNSIIPVNQSGTFSYTVPAGYTLYITDITTNGSTTCTGTGISINGTAFSPDQVSSFSAAGSNKISLPMGVPASYTVTGSNCGTSMLGFTVPTNHKWVYFDLSLGSYAVPAGQILVIKNMVSASGSTWNGNYAVGSNVSNYSKNTIFLDQGQAISATAYTSSPLMMVGYLKNR